MKETADSPRASNPLSKGSLLDFNGITIDLRHAPAPAGIAPLHSGVVLRERYVIEGRLGQGGKGTVYKALDRYRAALPGAHQYVAIKVLHQLSGDAALGGLGAELQCAQLLSHPNIVKIFDLDRDRGLDFMTMELLEGEPLSDLISRFRSTPLPRAQAWSLIRQVAEGLHHAHERGIVHADLKPQNIWVTSGGEIRILDFGAAHAFGDEKDGPAMRAVASVSPAYACCELLDGRTPDPRDDLYALACIAYELLSGAHPFQHRRATEARDFGVVPQRPDGLTRGQWHTLSRGLSWHRAGRSMHVGEWLRKLRPGRDAAPAPVDFRALKPTPRRAPKARYFRASVALTLLALTAAIWMMFVRVAPGGRVSGETLKSSTTGASMSSINPSGPAPLAPKLVAPTPVNGAANEIEVLPGEHFAEIRVHRPASLRGNVPFVWWTEGASAKPGVDYVHQSRADQLLPAGKDSVSVFVKLLPRRASERPGLFYIAVADRSSSGARHVAHTAVRLMASTS